MPLKPVEQFNFGGVDSRSNPINYPSDRCLLRRNFLIERDGSMRLRDGYTRVFMTYPGVQPPSTQPRVSLSSSSLNFGDCDLGQSSTAQDIVVANIGDAPLDISTIAASDQFSISTSAGRTVGITLNPGDTLTISVVFAPSTEGSHSGTVMLADNASDSPQVITVAGVGVVPGPVVTLDTHSVNFGNCNVGQSTAAIDVVLTNTGVGALSISTIVASAEFSVGTSLNRTTDITVDPGGTLTLQIAFTPAGAGTRSGTVVITDDASDSPQVINLTGIGVISGPSVQLSTHSVAFGNQVFLDFPTPRDVLLVNVGDSPLLISTVGATGEFAVETSQNRTVNITVAAGGSLTLRLWFYPTELGFHTGTIIITDNASDSPQIIDVSGTAI